MEKLPASPPGFCHVPSDGALLLFGLPIRQSYVALVHSAFSKSSTDLASSMFGSAQQQYARCYFIQPAAVPPNFMV